jgi:hypothetical protein
LIGEKALKAILIVIAAYHVLQGLLAMLDPGAFFDEIGLYGTENLHYVGDVGAVYLAYGAAIAAAVTRPSWRAPLLWLGCFWYGLHALNHAFDVDEARTDARGWADTIAIAFGALAAGWLARVSEGRGTAGQAESDQRR